MLLSWLVFLTNQRRPIKSAGWFCQFFFNQGCVVSLSYRPLWTCVIITFALAVGLLDWQGGAQSLSSYRTLGTLVGVKLSTVKTRAKPDRWESNTRSEKNDGREKSLLTCGWFPGDQTPTVSLSSLRRKAESFHIFCLFVVSMTLRTVTVLYYHSTWLSLWRVN